MGVLLVVLCCVFVVFFVFFVFLLCFGEREEGEGILMEKNEYSIENFIQDIVKYNFFSLYYSLKMNGGRNREGE